MPQKSHREQLLEGALVCLQEKGYARTTARDIAAASGANLASIGYHFGSKEGLLNEAVAYTCEEWTRAIGEATFAAPDASPLERVGRSWEAMLGSFEERRPLLVAFVEAMAQVERSDELRARMADLYRNLRDAVGNMVRASLGKDAVALGADPRVVASYLIAVCDGLVLQWLLDPEDTPDADQLNSSLGIALFQAIADLNEPTGEPTAG
jgi:AcrR family transcriptional regulator